MTVTKERRRHPRTAPAEQWMEIILKPGPDQVAEAPERRLRARVENISEGGVCLVCDEPFELGQVVGFLAPGFPDSGVVIWTSRSSNESKAGIKFA